MSEILGSVDPAPAEYTSTADPTPEAASELRTPEQSRAYAARKQGQIHRITKNLIARTHNLETSERAHGITSPNTKDDTFGITEKGTLTWQRNDTGRTIVTQAKITPNPNSSARRESKKHNIQKAVVSKSVSTLAPVQTYRNFQVEQDQYDDQLDGVSLARDGQTNPTRVHQLGGHDSKRHAAAGALAELRGQLATRENEHVQALKDRVASETPPPQLLSIDEILDA